MRMKHSGMLKIDIQKQNHKSALKGRLKLLSGQENAQSRAGTATEKMLSQLG